MRIVYRQNDLSVIEAQRNMKFEVKTYKIYRCQRYSDCETYLKEIISLTRALSIITQFSGTS